MSSPPLLSLLLLLLLPLPSSPTNLLLTNNTLLPNTQLSTPNSSLKLHTNCTLTLSLHNPHTLLFQSNSPNPLPTTNNCTLTLTPRGELQILQSPNLSPLWSSPSSPLNHVGRYAALLRPDGHLAIYGPSIWSTSPPLSTHRSPPPAISRNHIFSSQALYHNSKLVSGEFSLLVTDDCSLELVRESEGVVWESGTKGKGKDCFLRLDHRGQLAIVDEGLRIVWASKAGEVEGFYVLVVQKDGRAVVYGPAIWSTDAAPGFVFLY